LDGVERLYPEERPAHDATVDGFWMDVYPVTNAAFRRFVKATGYVTVAERPLDPADFPGADPALLVPGSLVFRSPGHPVDLHDLGQWWAYVPGACWRCPDGPGSTLDGRERCPVMHVAYEGGSYLCAPNYCLRYRPATRQGQAIDSSTSQIGFSCVVRPA
jgi:formylglycine-generating enzyme required for sulfatase activity